MKYANLIKEVEKCSFEELKCLLGNSENIKEDMQNFNIFKNINMREDSHTSLLAWLLNPNKDNKNDKNTIQYHFICNFIEFLIDNGYLKEDIDNIEQYVENLCSDLCVELQHNKIDLLLYSVEQNFICVIENKLDANICLEHDGTTQLEKYKNYIENEFIKTKKFDANKLNKLYLLLSSLESEKLENKRVKTVCKTGCNGEVILSNGEIISNKKFKYLLNKIGYKTIEHSDIVLMIYQTLKQFTDSPIAITKEDISEILKSIIDNYDTNEQNKQILQLILEKQNQEELNNFNIRIDKILCSLLEDGKLHLVLKILKQYIAYWEYHAKFVGGYSKIIDITLDNRKTYGVYAWNIKEILKKKQ